MWNDRAKSNWAILSVSMIVTADTMGVENCGMRRDRQRERERQRKRKKRDAKEGERDANKNEGCGKNHGARTLKRDTENISGRNLSKGSSFLNSYS